MMLFSNQVGKSAKPRGGDSVPGLAKIASGAAIITERERSARIGDMLMGLGAGVAVKCANPRATRPPADDERTASRKAVGKFISPPILRAIAKTGAVVPQGSDHFVEPQPAPAQRDLDFLHSPEVSADLRANIIDAVRRRVAVEATGDARLMYQWQDSITDLKFAIEDLINRLGPAASALSRILNGSGGGALAMTQGKALMRSALRDYGASIREGAAVRKGRLQKFYDVTKGGDDDGDDFDWRSYGYSQLHGHFDTADRKAAELWRGTIARVPSLVNDAGFLRWGAAMIRKYRLSAPMAKGVIGYVVGSFSWV